MTSPLLCCWETHHKMLTQIYMYFHASCSVLCLFLTWQLHFWLLKPQTGPQTLEWLNPWINRMSLRLLSAHVGTVHSDPSTIPSVCWTTRRACQITVQPCAAGSWISFIPSALKRWPSPKDQEESVFPKRLTNWTKWLFFNLTSALAQLQMISLPLCVLLLHMDVIASSTFSLLSSSPG